MGKSYFALYELFIAVKARKRVVFYYQPTNTEYVFTPTEGSCWCGIEVATCNCDLYLYDCATNSPPVLPAALNIIMFCSPDIINYREFIENDGDVLHMPVWTPAEMSAFARYGRTILCSVSPRTLRFDGYEKGRKTHMSAKGTSHMVLHPIHDKTFKEVEYVDFASPYVWRTVLNVIKKCSYSDTLRFVEGAKQYKELATLRGHIFEDLAHKELRKGGKFTVKNLKTNAESSMTLQKCDNSKEFHDLSDIDWATNDVYWTPGYPTFCSVDAIYTPDRLFQMTVVIPPNPSFRN